MKTWRSIGLLIGSFGFSGSCFCGSRIRAQIKNTKFSRGKARLFMPQTGHFSRRRPCSAQLGFRRKGQPKAAATAKVTKIVA